MSEALVPAAAEPVVVADGEADVVLPALIVDAGPDAVARFLEFFAGRIANARTRAAYGRAVGQFLAWCEARGLASEAVSPLHVAAYIRTHPGSVPTVKQHLAAIRMLCDWLVVSQVLPVNPAAAVRGPKHVVTKGATPVLTPAEARKLLDHIDTGTLAGLRDRALFSVMLYSFARVSAVLGMRRQDYFQQGSRGWLRLHEKGGKRHDVPAHHRAAEALDAYLEAAGLEDGREALFQSVDRVGRSRLTWAVVDAASGAGHDQAAGGDRRAVALDVLPHVPGDGDHGVSVERRDAGARPADRRARVAEDDEALRPDGRHGDGRRDRTHRDLNESAQRPLSARNALWSSRAALRAIPAAGVPGSARGPRRIWPLQVASADAGVGWCRECGVERESVKPGSDHTRKTFITSSPRWFMTLTAMRPDSGRSNGREMSLWSVAQASGSISAFRVVLRALYGSLAPRK